MSIVPLVFRDWWEDMDRPVSRIWDQYFGRGLNRDDLISEFSNLGINRPFPTPFRSLLGNNSTYYRPWRTVTRQNSGGSSTIKMEKDNFQVILDVQQFSPDEITVKTVEKNVVVEAKHEERQDEHGFISRHFVRRYVLPTDYDAINVTSTLSSDGVLTITAPRKVIFFLFICCHFPSRSSSLLSSGESEIIVSLGFAHLCFLRYCRFTKTANGQRDTFRPSLFLSFFVSFFFLSFFLFFPTFNSNLPMPWASLFSLLGYCVLLQMVAHTI
ncbi:protein lethal(2)essential for life-like isoform X1 [Vespa mandarinia]|uniref:protein lethal(2)essential for life-like isoform X1 n=1 Tax=Vespa mandarinia TaxID=7446 RepID=UPI001616A380|nr:protein lethal(2)essential for life-like isoform X1 [Vespa mandarinia]XP_035737339.1 protein lethal(2)essential for life-like isoform X1 [Vespa mandarinia]